MVDFLCVNCSRIYLSECAKEHIKLTISSIHRCHSVNVVEYLCKNILNDDTLFDIRTFDLQMLG